MTKITNLHELISAEDAAVRRYNNIIDAYNAERESAEHFGATCADKKARERFAREYAQKIKALEIQADEAQKRCEAAKADILKYFQI